MSPDPPRDVTARSAVLFLAVVILFGQLGNEVLSSVDGVVYAVVGQELADRPVWQWANLTWRGIPFFEHPPLTPWLLALSFRVLGDTTLAALLVPTALSMWTVVMVIALGRRLKDEAAGLLAGLVLALTPQFVKAGRNPMLEPALQAMVTLSVLCFLRARQDKRLTFAFTSGLALGLAWMAKGPPAFLALPVSIAASRSSGSTYRGKETSFWLTYLAGAVLLPLLFELWRLALGVGSFWTPYFSNQLRFTVIEGRDDPDFNWTLYLRILLIEFQPWIVPVLAAVPVLLWKRDRSLKPLWLTGWVWVLATVIPYTLMRHKSSWYIHIYYPGLALITASLFHFWLGTTRVMKWAPRIAMSIALPVVFLSSAFPSLFTRYERPAEWFLDGAQRKFGRQLEGSAIASCIPFDPWRAPFYYRFYFRAEAKPCDDVAARYQVVDLMAYQPKPGERVLFASPSWLLVDRHP